MQKSQIADWAWKGFTILLSMIVIPSFIWIWDSEMRLGALEYKMDDANKSLDKIVNHIEGETGDSAVQRKVEMKLMEQRVITLEKNHATLKRDVTRIKTRR
tara:strand:+ start:1123 stop:1425 length:303 start_codon:yes stop_codon:yes gene_type:complete